MRLSRLIVVVLALASPALAERLDLPSQGLENRVEFWKKVYTKYGMDDVIIHDRIHVNLIYDVRKTSGILSDEHRSDRFNHWYQKLASRDPQSPVFAGVTIVIAAGLKA